MPTFTDLGLCEPVCRALDECELGEPTAFQQRAISLFLHGRDLLLITTAGPERTAAYVVPMLHRLSEPVIPAQPKEPRGLVLTSAREEADAIGLTLESFGRHVPLRHLVTSSHEGWAQHERQLRSGTEILVTTPRRLLELLRERAVKLTAIEIAVIDDLDEMLDQGFEPDLHKIVVALPGTYQTVAFAVAPVPELRPFAQAWMRNPLSISRAAPAARKAGGKAVAQSKRVASTLKLPDWLDEPPPELMPAWLGDEPGAAAPASGGKKRKGGTRKVPAPAASEDEGEETPPAADTKTGSGKQAKDDLPAWLDDEPAAAAPAAGAKKRKTRPVPAPAEAEEAPPEATETTGSGKQAKDDLPGWLDDEQPAAPASAAKTRKRGTRSVATPAEAAGEQAPPPAPPTAEAPPSPPAKKTGTRRRTSAKGKKRRAP